jgi:hypothetical protein
MRNFVRQLLAKDRPVRVGVVGGSITFRPNDVHAMGWWAKFTRFLTYAFPGTQILAKNGGIPGVPSSYALMCLEIMLDEQVDLVFIEFVANDAFEDSIVKNRRVAVQERLIRKILAMPHKPAVVLMHVSGWMAGWCAACMCVACLLWCALP